MAKKLDIDFIVILHKSENRRDENGRIIRDANNRYVRDDIFYLHYLIPNHTEKDILEISCVRKNKAAFLQWWREKKYGRQVKPYQSELGLRIKSSYFDMLLENNNSSWSGNVDGFLIEERGECSEVSAIIEVRVSSYKLLTEYNPQEYFSNDVRTWTELKKLADDLSVPMYLLTYSRRMGERFKVSAAVVRNVDPNNGLTFGNDSPGEKVFTSANELMTWMRGNGYR